MNEMIKTRHACTHVFSALFMYLFIDFQEIVKITKHNNAMPLYGGEAKQALKGWMPRQRAKYKRN